VGISMAKADMSNLNIISRGANGIAESFELDENGSS
jgi:hypothetical protein